MFASNALPLPVPFGHEHRPLRLTSESSRPQPHGGCHYQAPSAQYHRCTCQSYQQDRRSPENVCDCGHPACFHSPTTSASGLSSDRVITALAEKIKKLEEYIAKERQTRKDELARERGLWENEARMLREALSPLYGRQEDIRKKLIDLTDKVDASCDVHKDLREHIAAVDAFGMNLERRMQMCEEAYSRKRKASTTVQGRDIMSPETCYTSASSVESDVASSTDISPQSASPVNPPLQVGIVVPSPRSSGVLNHRATLMSTSRDHGHDQYERESPAMNGEPRSSGFLSIDLAQRMRKKQPSLGRLEERLLPVRGLRAKDHKAGLPAPSSSLHARPQSKTSSGAIPVSGLLSNSPTRPESDLRVYKKRKQQEDMMALDVLVNASMATPLAQCS